MLEGRVVVLILMIMSGEEISGVLKINNTFVVLSENERKIKTYHCTSLKRPRGEGYLTVTNKRVVFHGYGESGGGKSRLISEVPIETISGISAYYGHGFHILLLLVGIIFALGFLASLKDFGMPSIMLLGIAVICFIMSNKPSYNLSIYSSGANGSPINIGAGEFGNKITGQGAAFSIIAAPTKETETMMNEIGAIVLDFKAMGDHAINKWLQETPSVQNKSVDSQSVAIKSDDKEFFS